ncbi:MAG: hypothetical protein GY932_03495 [Arcobacter sp.]|nr:hypothetical protein [Arcobacter sp.]
MNSILILFANITSYIGVGTLLLPIIADLIARKKNVEFVTDLKLFEFYIFFTLVMQIIATILFLKGMNNLFLFRLYLPIHTGVFTYFLLKWSWSKNKKIISLVSLSVIISVLGDIWMGDSNTPPYFMLVLDAILLFGLSFYVSFVNDKKKIHLPQEYNFIHIGIYLYSILTLIGFILSQTGYFNYGYFLQSVAMVISNYYFARSFTCLFHSRG